MAHSVLTTFVIFGVIILCIWKFVIYPVYFSPLSKIPNAHWTSPISSVWILWVRLKGRNNRTIHAAHEKYGPIVRLGPSEISINCIEGGVKTVYGGGFEKHDWYPRVFSSYGTFSMFSMTSNKLHSDRKRMVSNIYSKSHLQHSLHIAAISRKMIQDRLLPIIIRLAVAETPCNVHDLNQAFTMDFISGYLFGLTNATDFQHDVGLRQQILHAYHCRKPYDRDSANQTIDDWGLELCSRAESHLASIDPQEEPVVYKQLKRSINGMNTAEARTNVNKQHLELACEMMDHLTAGFETTAVALTYLFWELSRHPDLQSELRRELLTLSPQIVHQTSGSFSLPSPKMIDALPLLHAVIMETLRLHAPIPGMQPRILPAQTTLVGYKNIPAGVRVNAQAYSLHRNRNIFPEPHTWTPQRWLKDPKSPELVEMRRWFWGFGSGGRMCIGSNLALQEMKLATAAIYTSFSTTIVDDDGIEEIDAYTVKPTSDKLVLKFKNARAVNK
ncbi:putative cytochrome P450 monooxygenase [Xylogone sp. PMI_703]|nr:putative cytochrome P450 monooxygenase [Xylogone sp. PMI_703]